MRGLTRRLVAVAAAATSIVAVSPVAAQAHGTSYVKVGYFTQWGIYGRNFQLSKVQKSGAAARLTHLNYAFGTVTADGVCASADRVPDKLSLHAIANAETTEAGDASRHIHVEIRMR